MDKFILWLYPETDMTSLDNQPITATVVPPEAPKQPPTASSMLDTFCIAIRDFEGSPGALNYQLNNPGDCRPSPVGYLPKYGNVIIIDTDTNPKYPYHKGKFAMFPTYELGWEYLENMVHYLAVEHPNWTILDFFTHYAPSSDSNSPAGYAANVAHKCGRDVHTILKDLLLS